MCWPGCRWRGALRWRNSDVPSLASLQHPALVSEGVRERAHTDVSHSTSLWECIEGACGCYLSHKQDQHGKPAAEIGGVLLRPDLSVGLAAALALPLPPLVIAPPDPKTLLCTRPEA